MKYEDLTPEQQQLLATDFPEDMEKAAMDKVAMCSDMYQTGMNKLAEEAAKEMDDAEKKDKPEEKLDEGEKKEAAARGAFIARGFIDGLKKLGSERHKDELHYLYPFVAEKVAMKMPNMDIGKVMSYIKGKAKGGASAAGAAASKGKEQAMAAANKAKEHMKAHKGKYLAGAGGAAAGVAAGRASKD